MSLEDLVSNYNVYILIGNAILVLVLFILCMIQKIKISRLNKTLNHFISGNDAKSMEELILTRFDEIDHMKQQFNDMSGKVDTINETLLSVYQKMAIVKYDAFKEMGGKLSFALALLDNTNNGFIINSMHSSREGCYTYVKEIIHGESFIALSEEEKQALDNAINKNNYME